LKNFLFSKKVLEAWSSGLNNTKYENVSTLLKENCKRNITDEPFTPLAGISEQIPHYYK